MRGFVVYTALDLKRAIHIRKLLLIAVLLLFTGCYLPEYHKPVNPPKVFYADYGRVWDAAVDTLDEMGFVIVQMRKSNGYISTDKRERDNRRVKVSLRFLKDGEGIYVKITESTTELLVGDDKNKYSKRRWISVGTSGLARKEIRRRMYWKLPRPEEEAK
jgi:hypothetical protein